MKARETGITGVLALVALVAAYATWQRPRETASKTDVTVLDATKQSLEKVRFEDGTRFMELTRVDGDPWVTLGFLPGKEPVFDAGIQVKALEPDGGVDGGVGDAGVPTLVTVKPPEVPPTRLTRANDRGDQLLNRFTPLTGTRALGVLDENKLKELGLTDSPRRLDITVAGSTRRFVVSKPQATLGGTYVLEEATQKVFLLPGALLSELDPSSQVLVDRRLHKFQASELTGFTVTLDGKKTDFLIKDAQIPQTTKVMRAETPDKPDELAKNWHDKIWNRLIVTEVLGKGEVPKAGEPQVMLRIDYTSHGTPKGWLEIGMDEKTKGTWARSENTANWVAVHQGADEMIIEAKKVVSGT